MQAKEPTHLITTKPYLAPLEGWRGVMALSVVFYHFYGFFAAQPFLTHGYLGVDFFFILSGFIITRQYEAGLALRRITPLQFMVRRAARLWPAYMFSIALFLAVNRYILIPHRILNALDMGIGPTYLWRLLAQLAMLGSMSGMPAPWNGPAWSVSVEWIVNLLFLGAVWRYRHVPSVVLWTVLGCAEAFLLSVSPRSLDLCISATPIFNTTIARGMVGFTLGSLIYRYHHQLPDIPRLYLYKLEIALIATVVALVYLLQYSFPLSFDYLLQLIFLPALIILSLYRKGLICWFFSLPVFTFLGRISYSIYLLHYPLGYAMEYSGTITTLGMPALGFVYMVVVIGVAALSYALIETPGRWLGRFYLKRWQVRQGRVLARV